jgi:hypothetical protein
LISANGYDSTLTVLTNNGSGVLGFNATLNVGNAPNSVTVADVNGDGKPDLISANAGDSTLTVLTNNGGGIFVFNATLNVGNYPYSVAVADINDDGKPDLICANTGDSTLTVLTNNGGGIFGFNATLNAGSGPYSVAAADVNGDGKPELISANAGDSTLTVLFAFSQKISVPGAVSLLNTANNLAGSFAVSPGGNLRLDDQPLYLRSGSDVNHGLAYAGNGVHNFGSAIQPDGPVLWGYGGGVLGTASSGQKAILTWNSGGVSVNGSISGNGGGLTNLNASQLSSGKIPLAQLPGAVLTNNNTTVVTLTGVFTGNGGGLTNLNISQFTSGTNSGAVTFNNPANNFNGAFAGNGGGLTNLNATQLAGGTVPLTQLSGITSNQLAAATWQLATNLNGGRAALATNVVSGIAITNAFITNSVFAGNGGDLTNLNAAQLAGGTVPLAQLSGITSNQLNVTTWQLATNLNGGNAALATNVVSGIAITNAYITNSVFAGNGGGLTNLNVRLNDGNMYFRSATDINHGLGWFGPGKPFANNTNLDGPVLFGYGGGALGSTYGGQDIALSWDAYGDLSGAYLSLNNGAAQAFNVSGRRGGDIGSPVAYVENTNTNGNTAPALRVVGYGNTASGALSVSAQGSGLIAQFGNSSAFVAYIANDGTIYSKGVALTSDRNAKENFTPLDARMVLARVAALPVTEWNYKDDAADKKHIGPVAQDFQAAFGLDGADDKHISVVDESGVALAAIQGLNQKLDEKDAQIADLKTRLEKLEQLMTEKPGSAK